MPQPCVQVEKISRLETFYDDFKFLKHQLVGIIAAIIAQIVIFGFLWGQLTNTVSKNTEYLWGDISTSTRENTRNLDRLMSKLEDIKFIAIKGDQGIQGVQGIQGESNVNSRRTTRSTGNSSGIRKDKVVAY